MEQKGRVRVQIKSENFMLNKFWYQLLVLCKWRRLHSLEDGMAVHNELNQT